MLTNKDIADHISSHTCNHCEKDTSGFKCPKCGHGSHYYEPDHFKTCKDSAKMRAKCQACNEAEDNCTC
ncbi:MAG: hypothetical protein AAB930_00055 [Patescibacteria group bacterium]